MEYFCLQELYTKLVAELKEQIYIRSTKEIVALTRQGSARDSADQSSPNASSSERKTPSKRSQFRLAKSLEVPGSAKYANYSFNILFVDCSTEVCSIYISIGISSIGKRFVFVLDKNFVLIILFQKLI